MKMNQTAKSEQVTKYELMRLLGHPDLNSGVYLQMDGNDARKISLITTPAKNKSYYVDKHMYDVKEYHSYRLKGSKANYPTEQIPRVQEETDSITVTSSIHDSFVMVIANCWNEPECVGLRHLLKGQIQDIPSNQRDMKKLFETTMIGESDEIIENVSIFMHDWVNCIGVEFITRNVDFISGDNDWVYKETVFKPVWDVQSIHVIKNGGYEPTGDSTFEQIQKMFPKQLS